MKALADQESLREMLMACFDGKDRWAVV